MRQLIIQLACIFAVSNSFSQIASSRITEDWGKTGVLGGIPCWNKEIVLSTLKSDGTTDNTAALTAAINTYKGTKTILRIPAGTFLFKSRIDIPKEGQIMLLGAGPAKTVLRFTVGNIKGNGLFNIDAGGAVSGTEANITAGLTKGSKTLTVSSSTNFNIGDWVEIDMANPSIITSNTAWNVTWANRCLGQIFKVTGKNGNILSFDREVHITYPDPGSTKIRKLNMTEFVGFENFKLDVVCTATDDKYNVNFQYAANCWMKLIHSEKSVVRHVNTPNSANITITDCYFNDSYNHGNGGYGYGVVVDLHTTNCLIQNNIFQHLRHSMMCKLGANGNVFAYNYSHDPYWSISTSTPSDLNQHGHLPHMNLFEGNIAGNICADDVWGPAWDGTTYFRNRQYATDRDLALDGPNKNLNIVGNEMVVAGRKISIDPLNTGTYQDGNNLNGSTTWNSTNTSRSLVNSYYLTAKPSWWGTGKWPSIGPSNSINSGNIPAYDRFLAKNLFVNYYCGDAGSQQNCSASISTTTPTTFCQGGSVVLTASAGTSYIWRNGNTTLSTTTQTHTANAAGTYTVEVTNANGCKATSTATTVTVNPLPTATISTTTPTTFCQGGSVVLTASAGTSYIWRNGNTTLSTTAQTLTANAAGTYTVEVTNANGCKATSSATTVTVNPLPTATISTTTPTTFCQGGSVVLTATAGSSYIWRNGNTTLSTTTQTHTANAAGTYTVEVTNANSCKATSATTTVTVNPLPTATISTTTPITFCQGGSVVLTASAGTSYIWRNGNTTLSTTAQTHTANAAGTYTVEVTNANGCIATSSATTVTVNPLPTATISITTPTTFCQGGSVVLTASAGTSYIWRNGNTVLATTTQTHTANAAGTYTVEVTNANGCKATSASTTVTVNPLPIATISTTTPTTFCQGGSVVLTASAGSSYIWRNGNTILTTTAQTHTANAAGTYTVEVTNANGCKATSTATPVEVQIPTTWYADADNDGWGDINTTKTECTQPVGYVAISGDNCPSTSNPSQTNTDGDAQGDACDTDDDNDGIADANDCAPLDKNIGVATTWYADADNDGLGDINTTKTECTQPVGYVAISGDNCPSISNPSQTNTDGDAQGDACDTDDDNDGIDDANDCAPLDKNIGVATTWYADADNDGLGDFNTTKTECTQPVGYVSTSGDNCPNDMNKTNPGNCGCGNTENSCLDCFGTPNGTAFLDDCKVCVSGLTQKEACVKDCHGDFGGTAFVDSCGKCAGGNTGLVAITDKDKCITSIEEITNTNSEVQPNPFSNKLEITAIVGSVESKLFDAMGKLVAQGSRTINTSHLAEGVYHLVFNSNGTTKVVKLIKVD